MIIRDRTLHKGLKKRHIAVLLGACLMLPSVAVHALGIGEIEVESALNEPLKAEIKLLSATKKELNTLEIALASNAAFARMGIDKLPVLSSIEFELVREGAGAPFIRAYSKKPIREPFLDFILTVSWANGQLLREYTLLLDPPVFQEAEKPAPVAAPVTQPAEIVRSQQRARPAPVARVAEPGSFGPTSRKDTLWGIAKDMRPDRSVSVPQMMMALLKENPEAFGKGNINNLRAGYILRAPQMEVITAMSKSQAADETNRQYQEWLASKGKAPAASGEQRVATPAESDSPATPSSSEPVAATAGEQSARLQLLTPDESVQRSGVGSSIDGAGDSSTEQQLAIALEAAEASKQENADLRMRLAELEKQLQDVQRLISLKNDAMGALQAGITAESEEAAPEGDIQAGAIVESEDVAAEAVVAEEKAVEPKVVTPAPAPKQEPEQLDAIVMGIIDDVLADPLADPKLLAIVAGVPLILVLAVVSLIRRRRQTAEDTLDIGAEPSAAVAEESAEAVAAAPAAEAAVAEESPQNASGETADEAGFGDFVSADVSSIHTEENEIDPVAEADVYLAYRRYEQAEALLKEAIRADDDRSELKLKLLEIYFTSKNKDAFEAQAEALYASLGGEGEVLWNQAVEMGRELCPDHPLFSDDATPLADMDSADADLGAGVSDDVGLDFESSAPEEKETEADSTDSILSGEDLANSLDMPGTEAAVSDTEGGLDLDLNLGEDESVEAISDEAVSDTEAEPLEEVTEADNTLDLDAGMADVDLTADLDDLASADVASDDMVSELDDLSAELDGLDELSQGLDDISTELDSGDVDLADLEDLADTAEAAEPDKKEPGADWEIAPAVSSFESRNIKTEADDGYIPDVRGVDKAAVENHDLDHLQLDESLVETDAEPDSESVADDVADMELPEQLLADNDEEETDIFDNSGDVVGTKLDLAKAYIDMGDQDGARAILDEVSKEGDDDQRQEAEQLIQQIS